jgi:Rrf2 family protein
MRISAKADYAVRAAAELAAVGPNVLVKAGTLAESQQIPQHFLENILADLRRAGVVRTQRGAEGGSTLARPADQISLADVLRAIEGPLAAVRDVRPDELVYVGAAAELPTVWVALRAGMRNVLEHVTLADLVSGRLPPAVTDLTADPDAWKQH